MKKIAFVEGESHGIAGQIIAIDSESIVVSCERGSLKIVSVQPNSKKEMNVLAYINGKRLKIEDTLL